VEIREPIIRAKAGKIHVKVLFESAAHRRHLWSSGNVAEVCCSEGNSIHRGPSFEKTTNPALRHPGLELSADQACDDGKDEQSRPKLFPPAFLAVCDRNHRRRKDAECDHGDAIGEPLSDPDQLLELRLPRCHLQAPSSVVERSAKLPRACKNVEVRKTRIAAPVVSAVR
jgi:hypothetical protein